MACANDEELDVNRSDIDRVRRWRRSMLGALGVFGAVCLTAIALPAMADAPAPANQQTVRTWCAGCHTEDSPGHFQRLSVIRKSPEGWQMTIFRMQHVHNLALPEDARNAIIKYLSDTQGLAPAESAAGRFALERRPNMPDLKPGGNLPVMCGRCHSLARVALQRRDADEWLKHMHMHVGQFPSLEYQASARDIHWWEIATTQLPAKLGAMFPFDSPEWRAWKDRPHADLSGDWLVHGHNPGGADFVGTLSVKAAGDDDYTAHYSLQTASGEPDGDFDSKVRVFTGYEWRGTSKPGAVDTHEVLALSEDGKRLTGRWFEAAHPEVGGDVVAEQGYQGHYASFDLKQHEEVSHINIDKMDSVHEQLVTAIAQLATTPLPAKGESVPLRYVVPPDAPLELWDSGTPQLARSGDTLQRLATLNGVPLWSLTQANQYSDSAPLSVGQRVLVPRRLVPPVATAAASRPKR